MPLITRTPIIDDDGSGRTGTVIDNAWKQEFYNQIDANSGSLAVPYGLVAADFTANNGGAWTLISGTGAWAFNQALSTLTLFVNIANSTIVGTPTNLMMKIPAGRVAIHAALGPTYFQHPGVAYEVGVIAAFAGNNLLYVHRPAVAAFAPGTCSGSFTITLPLIPL
jgi:hypothetical protein